MKTNVTRSFEGIEILIVDDSVDNLEILKIFLTHEGAKVDEASNGPLAINLATQKKYDLILMDIQMPEMNGNQVIAILRSQNYQGLAVALSAHHDQENQTRSIASGFNEYLTKPISFERLKQTILKFCS